jgi:hypothetical protein
MIRYQRACAKGGLMLATLRKCTLWLLGMAAAGSILGAKGSYA